MNQKRILLVEDEKNLAAALKLNLDIEGFYVVTAGDGLNALEISRAQKFDLLILDVMLPGMDGFSLCESIRLTDTVTPILFLTAKGSSAERVKGLKLGADDYLGKPFDLQELLLRVKNLLKRNIKSSGEETDSFEFSGNKIIFSRFEAVNFSGQSLRLTKTEIKLLKLLFDKKNEVVSREHILNAVWGYNVFPTTRTIDNYIVNFRKLFERKPKEPQHFLSVRSVGYLFKI